MWQLLLTRFINLSLKIVSYNQTGRTLIENNLVQDHLYIRTKFIKSYIKSNLGDMVVNWFHGYMVVCKFNPWNVWLSEFDGN